MVSSVSSSSGNSFTVSPQLGSLAMLAVENFAKSFDKGNDDDDANTKEANAIISAADADKSGSVSLDELKNFDKSTCASEMADKINDLINNFKSYDKNGDGALDLNEIKSVIGDKQYSLQELRQMAADANKENSLNEDNNGANFTTSSDAFVQSLIDNNYKSQNTTTETVSYDI